MVLDWKNAFNCVHRSRVVHVIRSTPSVRVWLRAYNSHTAPMSPIYYRGDKGLVKNDYASVTGGQQGDLMGSDGYCLATLEDNRWLDAELGKHGGSYRAGMDDGVLHGPAEVVWDLVERYIARVELSCGLSVNRSKSKCWSPNGHYGARPADFPIGELTRRVRDADGAEREEVAGRGVVLWGSPMGDSGFVRQVLAEQTEEIRSLIEINKSVLVSRDPDAFLQVLRQSLCHRWDYWQQTQPPRLTVEFSLLIDADLDAAAAAAMKFDPFDPAAPYRSVDDMPEPSFVAERARLPCRLRGLGQRSHADVGPAAWVGSVNIAVPSFIARESSQGGREPGLFEHLTPLVGDGSFDEERDDFRFRGFIAAGSRVSIDFIVAWQMMAAEPSLDPEGPLALGPESCGHGEYVEQLQRAVTKHREDGRFRRLQELAMRLPATDHRRVAFVNCDSMAATWITAERQPQRGKLVPDGPPRVGGGPAAGRGRPRGPGAVGVPAQGGQVRPAGLRHLARRNRSAAPRARWLSRGAAARVRRLRRVRRRRPAADQGARPRERHPPPASRGLQLPQRQAGAGCRGVVDDPALGEDGGAHGRPGQGARSDPRLGVGAGVPRRARARPTA